MWSLEAGSFAAAARIVTVRDWLVEASVRGAQGSGVLMAIGWQNTEAGYFAVYFAVGDIVERDQTRSHYRIAVVRNSEDAIVRRGLLDGYDYLEYTTISAGLDDGELVLRVGDTEVGRFGGEVVNVTMEDLTFINRVPPDETGNAVFVDWVRVWRRPS